MDLTHALSTTAGFVRVCRYQPDFSRPGTTSSRRRAIPKLLNPERITTTLVLRGMAVSLPLHWSLVACRWWSRTAFCARFSASYALTLMDMIAPIARAMRCAAALGTPAIAHHLTGVGGKLRRSVLPRVSIFATRWICSFGPLRCCARILCVLVKPFAWAARACLRLTGLRRANCFLFSCTVFRFTDPTHACYT